MPPSTICVDAGIVIRRILFPEDVQLHRLWAKWEQRNSRMIAPALLLYEVVNVLYRYQRQGLLTSGTINLAIQAALAFPIELSQDKEIHLNAYQIAQKFDLPAAYDAHYLALAEMSGADFWTADKQLYNSLEKHQLSWVNIVN